MSIARVALIYDSTLRPETTGTLCERALKQLVTVEHFQSGQADQIPTGFDLYLQIDDGLQHSLPGHLKPSAWWAIDTHLSFSWCLERSAAAELVFAAQKDGASALQSAGIVQATWLPLACDPSLHRPWEVKTQWDFCFIGNLVGTERQRVLRVLQNHFPSNFVGQRYFEEMARTYGAARIVFNRSVRNDLNMRVFEALGCGAFLLTNDLSDNGQADLFRDGVHLATWRDDEELLDKMQFYREREDLRKRIATAGRQEVLARHTYRHRMEAILRAAEELPSRPVPVAAVAETERSDSDVGLSRESSDPRDPFYFEWARPELLELIPLNAGRVLDVGCAAGRLGEALKQRQAVEVIGIDLDPLAAQRAAQRLDRVLCINVEQEPPVLEPGSLDVIVCGDVLEHLRDPDGFLKRARSWLRPGGLLIASLPNVRHHSVIGGLLTGNWTYEAAGLLDQDHVRFFGRASIETMLQESGYELEHFGMVPGPGWQQWKEQGQPGTVTVGRLRLEGLTRPEAEEYYVYQYLVRARPRVRTAAPDSSREWTAPQVLSGPRGMMCFEQDFRRDFDQFSFRGEPFAFIRCADGERAILTGASLDVLRDGWSYGGGQTEFSSMLMEALTFAAPDYYVGISDGCCDPVAREWYLQKVQVPLSQITFSNVFVNANYQRFRQIPLQGMAVVGSGWADYRIPANVVSQPFDFDALVAQLLKEDRPILVAAGPASPIIIHRYWQRAVRPQVIVDVGSALDEWTHGRKTRSYQQPGTRTAGLVCQW